MLMKDVKAYYSSTVSKEWARLRRDSYRRLEYQTTMHYLHKYLPPHGRVLDAGCGPGRYSMELAKEGYRPTLFDLTPLSLEFARSMLKRKGLLSKVDAIAEGSIDDMACFPDDRFDGVICLGGPLSHLLDSRRRRRAAKELVRVARPGAPVFASVMSRLGVLPIELARFQNEIELPLFREVCDTGDYDGALEFTACHFFLPEELRSLMEGAGGETLDMAALEFVPAPLDADLDRLSHNRKRWDAWMYAHFKYCNHPGAVGSSDHMLIVCRKLRAGQADL